MSKSLLYDITYYTINFRYTFLQVAGSAFRLLTNIPHCCGKNRGLYPGHTVTNRPFSHGYVYSN